MASIGVDYYARSAEKRGLGLEAARNQALPACDPPTTYTALAKIVSPRPALPPTFKLKSSPLMHQPKPDAVST
jgi:hypothetical protein